MSNTLVKLFGFPATLLHGDWGVLDRWWWLRKNLKKGNLHTLDAGCGSGAFSLYAAMCGNSVIGISFDDPSNQKARSRAKILNLPNAMFITADLRELDEKKDELGLLDQIICCETIEHIVNDQKLLRDFYTLLNPGGRVFITAPYKFYKRLPGDAISEKEDGGHVRWGYTHDEMQNILEKAGLTLVSKTYITGPIAQFFMRMQRYAARIHPLFAWALVLPFRVFQFADPMVWRLLPAYPGLSIGVVAKKI